MLRLFHGSFLAPIIIAGVDEAVIRNIEAAKQLAQIVSSSLGPNGTCVCGACVGWGPR